jgi:peroxiredoxin
MLAVLAVLAACDRSRSASSERERGASADHAASGSASAASTTGAEAFAPMRVGDVAPPMTVAALVGAPIRLGGAGPVTVLNLWATWCTSCREEMADLNAMHAEFAPLGARVVGVSIDAGDPSLVARFAKSAKLAFTVALDPTQDVKQQYQIVGVPETLVIAADGRIAWRHVGNIHTVTDSLRGSIRAALASASAVTRGTPSMTP